MFRKNCLVIYFCLISLAACRHLDNALSDARTKQKPMAAMLKAEPVGDGINPTSIAQIGPTVSSRDAATTNNITTMSPALHEDIVEQDNMVKESKSKDLTKPSEEKVSDIRPTQDNSAQSKTGQEIPQVSENPAATLSKIDTYLSIKRKGTVNTRNERDGGNFKKEHAHIEAVYPTNNPRSSVGDKIQATDPELPYDKLDNVNVVSVDNSPPVVRPVLNHLDNDNANKIETISTVNDIDASLGASSANTNETPREQIINKESSNNMTDLLSEDGTKEILPTSSSMEAFPVTTTRIAGTKDTQDTSPKTDEIPSEAPIPIQTSAGPTTEPVVVLDGEADRDVRATPESKTGSSEEQRDPNDVDPLDIFVDDIKYQRFPDAMSLSLFKEKISGKTFKKLYILESSEKKLFQHVRQLEVTYDLDGNDLYAEFLFRFIYSRQCTRIERFKLGTMSNDSKIASFEKEVEGDKTERLVFFSQRPDDYVFFMSCTDLKTSPYACRDTYYVTLDSKHDPPNQFPWLSAAQELESQMNLNFQDPRFIFNFVMMPCARE